MGAVSGQGTTFNILDYHGQLFTVTPTETPFLSAIGGLNSAKRSTAVNFEWQTIDRRTSTVNNAALEGAAAPAGAERTRTAISNVLEIHHSAVELSYTKMGAYGQFSGINVAPQWDDIRINEMALQTGAELESMAVDIEQSFLNGTYAKPGDNATARTTQGIIGAATGNNTYVSASVGTQTVVASTGVWTSSGTTGFAIGDSVYFGPITTTTGVKQDTRYFVLTIPSGTTYTVSATSGGAALTLVGNGSSTAAYKGTAATKATVDNAFKTMFDNGALLPQASTVLVVGSALKVAVSNLYATATLNQIPFSRTVGGVAIDTLVTDFGTFGIMVDRWMPAGHIGIFDLGECYPVFLDIPGKGGLLFVEQLALTGSSEKYQMYCEIGLEYGAPTHHGVIRGAL